MNKGEGSADIGVYDVLDDFEILVEKRAAKASAGIRHQKLDGVRQVRNEGEHSIYARHGRKILDQGLDPHTKARQPLCGIQDVVLIGHHDQVVSIPGGTASQFVTDAA